MLRLGIPNPVSAAVNYLEEPRNLECDKTQSTECAEGGAGTGLGRNVLHHTCGNGCGSMAVHRRMETTMSGG